MSNVIDAISAARLVPVVVLEDPDSASALGDALLGGGLNCVEVTFRTDAAAAAIRSMATNPELLVGAGTVVTAAQVDQAVEAGARYIVSPGFSSAVVDRCRELNVPAFPGIATATEIQMALDAGLDTVKFFPAGALGGPSMLKALAAPFRSVRFIPTGGVTDANLADYLSIPSVVAVGGTWMVAPDLLASGQWDEVRKRTEAAVAAAQSIGGARA